MEVRKDFFEKIILKFVYISVVVVEIREFDSLILEKALAGRIKPAFFMSNFMFLYVLVCNSVV